MAHAARSGSTLILVREWEQQMSSSGCCGRLQGDFMGLAGDRCFPERRAHMERAGEIYREARARYGDDMEILVVDPRNLVSLLPLLFREFRRHRVPVLEALSTLFRFGVNAAILDGRLVRGEAGRESGPSSVAGTWPDLA